MTKKALSYFDLVVEVVRGRTPIPEFQNRKINRVEIAKTHIAALKKKYAHAQSGNLILDTVMESEPEFLCMLWEKLCPPALTMCGDKSIEQLVGALKSIEEEQIPGDYIEAGVWRGGLPIIMRAFLQSIGNQSRKVWLADSFQGLPNESQDENDRAAHVLLEPIFHLSTSRKQVEDSLDFFGLLDEQVKILEGWFSETLKYLPEVSFSLVRLDGDYYESTRDALDALYPKLSPGGFLIVDDYNLPLGCKRAVDEYRVQYGLVQPLIPINSQAVYWRK